MKERIKLVGGRSNGIEIEVYQDMIDVQMPHEERNGEDFEFFVDTYRRTERKEDGLPVYELL